MTDQSQFHFGGKIMWSGVAATIVILSAIWALMWMLHGGAVDDRLVHDLRARSQGVVDIAQVFSDAGSWSTLIAVIGAAAILLIAAKRPLAAVMLIPLCYAGQTLTLWQKSTLALERPDQHLWLTNIRSAAFPNGNAAFPSGHAAESMLVYLAVALLLTRMGRQWRGLIPAAVTLVAMIGVSRVVLAVHWPSDVIAGWSFGAAWALLGCVAIEAVEARIPGPASLLSQTNV